MQASAKVEPRPGDPAITPALVAEHGLTPDEYRRLVDMLGREPTFTELGIVSALWSEHCSYKHSRPLLRSLPTQAPHVLQGPGENAGVVSIDPSYEGNPLVNAMCVGLLREDELIRAVAQGVGNPIIAVGARTGRDGIHGASFASEDLSEQTEAKRPRVQVGDPFTEKLLLEASLELIKSGAIVAIQDMGAAGLTSSSAEMAARGDVGVTIDTSKVPVREEGMTPYEILLSESQERMLVVAKRGHEPQVKEILAKWDLSAEVIGEVIAEPVYRVTEGERVVAEFPGSRLVTDCPVYHPEARESEAIMRLRARDVHAIAPRADEKDPAWT